MVVISADMTREEEGERGNFVCELAPITRNNRNKRLVVGACALILPLCRPLGLLFTLAQLCRQCKLARYKHKRKRRKQCVPHVAL